ncbi:MAG: hypothetical protein JWP88_2264 [Flaviaesturariibacter sp.]|nr:hypothetical protein [Flaviaesturariibacter sp.]
MKRNHFLTIAAFAGLITLGLSCVKDPVADRAVTPLPTTTVPGSFVEEFDNIGSLTSKGWVFKNNSNPIGSTGWRQGRYESAAIAQYKFLAPVAFLGFPAYSASATPNDFISCDVAAVNTSGDISAWLITPAVAMKNGDQIVFYTRAVDDSNYPVYTKDRMQVRANYTDGSAFVGNSPADTGNFSKVLVDINPTYANNDPSGYPRAWKKYTLTVSGIPGVGSINNGRFAFRYFAKDAGLDGGTTGANYSSIIGIDSLAFVHK